MSIQKKIVILLVITSCFLSAGFYIFLLKSQLTQKSLTVLGQVIDFNLTDSQGKSFSLDELKGKVWVADFIFTTCGGICPVMSQNMSRLYEHFGRNNAVHFVSISVNPENDTPEVLAEYAKRYSADPDQWHFLTGPRETIEHLAVNGFKVGSAKEPVFHSAYFILIDPRGNIRQYHEGTQTAALGKIKSDILTLLKENNL